MSIALPVLSPGQTERFKNVELEINTVCDLACFACDRMVDVTSAPAMTKQQVAHFVNESLELDWEWERIRLLGGEPTLHKDFPEMVKFLLAYRKRYPKCFLQVLTNGLGRSKDYRAWLEDNKVSLHAEAKEKGKTPEWFHNTRIVPLDRDPNVGILPPCGIFGIRGCGIGLTNHGYFLDGAGATIARVAGYDIGVMELKDVTWDVMMKQADVLCRICGHWNPPDHLDTEKVAKTGEVTGAFWTERLEAYKKNKPVLRMYGPQSTSSGGFVPLEVLK